MDSRGYPDCSLSVRREALCQSRAEYKSGHFTAWQLLLSVRQLCGMQQQLESLENNAQGQERRVREGQGRFEEAQQAKREVERQLTEAHAALASLQNSSQENER